MNKTNFLSALAVCSVSALTVTLFLETPAQSSYPKNQYQINTSSFLTSAYLTKPLQPLPPIKTASLTTAIPETIEEIIGSPVIPEIKITIKSVKAKAGDTLARILKKNNIDRTEAHAIITALKTVFDPRRLRLGQKFDLSYQAATDEKDIFTSLTFDPDKSHTIEVVRNDEGSYSARKIQKALTQQIKTAAETINSSLYVAGKRAGLSNNILSELIRAYSWDIDFQRDIRQGDSFEIMFDEFVDEEGQIVRDGDISLAMINLSGDPHKIYRHTKADGDTNYYDEKGRSARKALMRTPIDGARLSSGFGKRKHPILGYTKMHRGVDFAAARGTPIFAAGDGTVNYAGRKGAYGNYLRIRHNSEYTTAYAHMKGFARKVRKGTRVKQGQIIGYVGTTGRSTGPHLHYEIMRSGKQTNPMRVKMPSGEQLKGEELARFEKTRKSLDRKFTALTPDQEIATISD